MSAPVSLPNPTAFTAGTSASSHVLLLHGLTGSPQEVWPLGRALGEVGYHVESPLLRGHGTTPQDLAQTSADDLVAQARSAAEAGQAEVIGGLSMGALLALIVAAERPQTKALVLMATALRLQGVNGLFVKVGRVPLVGRLPWMLNKGRPGPGAAPQPPDTPRDERGWLPEEVSAAQVADAATPRLGEHFRYDQLPLRWGRELHRLQRRAAEAATRITCPVLVMHGAQDRTASPSGSEELARLLRSPVTKRLYPDSQHVLPMGPDRGAVAVEVLRFLRAAGVGGRGGSVAAS